MVSGKVLFSRSSGRTATLATGFQLKGSDDMSTASYLRNRLNASPSAADVLRDWNRGTVNDQGNPVEPEPASPGRQPDYSQGHGNRHSRPSRGNALNGRGVTEGIAESIRNSEPESTVRIDGNPCG